MRSLTDRELEQVSGGAAADDYSSIIVTGHRGSDGIDSDPWGNSGDHSGGTGGDGPAPAPTPPPSTENADHLTPKQVREAVDKIDQIRAAIQEAVDRSHTDKFQIKIGEVTTTAGHALDVLGHLATAVQAGTVGVELATGDKAWFHDAVTLAAGAAAGSAVATAGAGAGAEVLAGFVASTIADQGVEWINAFKEATNEYEREFEANVQAYVNTNSNIPADAYNNPVDLYDGMMGFPHVPRSQEFDNR